MQIPIIAAFICAGYRPTVLLPSRADRTAIELFTLVGVKEFAYWSELPASDHILSRSHLSAITTTAAALAIKRDGVRLGRYALSTMMRNLRRGRFDFSDSTDRRLLWSWLRRSEDAAGFADVLIERLKPDALLLNDQGYIPLGPLFDRCVGADIPAYTWNAAHRDGAVILKRYGRDNIDAHPASLSREAWNEALAQPWTDADWQVLKDEIEGCYRSGQWYGEVGTQFNKTFPDRATLCARLGLEAGRPTVLVFPHIFWDGTFFWGRDVFDDYEAFFTETMKVAYRTPNVNWIVKVHPANLVKNKRDGVTGRLGELRVLDSLGPKPPHIHVIDASSDISTLSLFEVGDVCVTVRGTVGLEAACFGLTTITAGTGRYDHLGFTIDPETPREFLDTIAQAHKIPRRTPDLIERARRYAYGILLERPTHFECIRFNFAQDSVATTRIEIDPSSQLSESREVIAMMNYINSEKEDFLVRHPPEKMSSRM